MMVFGTLFLGGHFFGDVSIEMLSFDSAGNEGFSLRLPHQKMTQKSIPRTEAFEAVHSLEAKRWADSYIIGLLSENGRLPLAFSVGMGKGLLIS